MDGILGCLVTPSINFTGIHLYTRRGGGRGVTSLSYNKNLLYLYSFSLMGSGMISIYLTHLKRKTSQSEIVLKLLACFNTQFRVKERFKLLQSIIAIKVKNTWQ